MKLRLVADLNDTATVTNWLELKSENIFRVSGLLPQVLGPLRKLDLEHVSDNSGWMTGTHFSEPWVWLQRVTWPPGADTLDLRVLLTVVEFPPPLVVLYVNRKAFTSHPSASAPRQCHFSIVYRSQLFIHASWFCARIVTRRNRAAGGMWDVFKLVSREGCKWGLLTKKLKFEEFCKSTSMN